MPSSWYPFFLSALSPISIFMLCHVQKVLDHHSLPNVADVPRRELSRRSHTIRFLCLSGSWSSCNCRSNSSLARRDAEPVWVFWSQQRVKSHYGFTTVSLNILNPPLLQLPLPAASVIHPNRFSISKQFCGLATDRREGGRGSSGWAGSGSELCGKRRLRSFCLPERCMSPSPIWAALSGCSWSPGCVAL